MKISPLKKGDTIAIISPAGCIKDENALKQAVAHLESAGYKAKTGKNVLASADYLAGNDKLRLEDLHWAFADTEIKAVLCARGGYGCTRILDKIDYDLLAQNPKIFLGSSDITALLNNLPFPAFHAPMAITDFGTPEVDKITKKSFFEVTEGIETPYIYEAMTDFEVLNEGTAEGILLGGNLSVLVSLLGTKYFPDLQDKILLLEDLNEPLYKIDRMLTQLRLSRVFEEIKGIVFAGFGDIKPSKDFFKSFAPTSIPAFYRFHASHERSKYTLPLGAEYKILADEGKLKLIENIFTTTL